MQVLVVSHKGIPVSPERSASFGVEGGSIGRADSSSLVLDDPERTVSRVHAQILCRDGRYFVIDRGSNPLACNGRPLGAGNEIALDNGDRLTIGSFELLIQGIGHVAPKSSPSVGQVHAGPMPSVDDPFADLLVGLEPIKAAAPLPARVPEPLPNLSPLLDNPMGSSPSAAAVDPFAGLLGPETGGPPRGSLPARLDDFSDLGIAARDSSSNLDQMFGLGPSGMSVDPLAESPLADPLLQPNTAHTADPMVALNSEAKLAAAASSDHVAALHHAYVPPVTFVPKRGSALEDFSDLMANPVTSMPQEIPQAVLASADVELASTPRPVAPSVTPANVSQPSRADEMMAAFLRGVGTTHQMPQTLTPALMERIGLILRCATEGTVQLLLSRQEFKREVRAEVTVIGAQRNNPLKFSPTADVALAHLLGPGIRGFMPPDEAMQDAFNDLRAHQFGVMVGLHAALAHVLTRFTPEVLEKRLTEKSAFDALFSAGRKAKLWDQFCALHASISSEAEDDFHSLFGKAFSQAYDEQMARFKAAG